MTLFPLVYRSLLCFLCFFHSCLFYRSSSHFSYMEPITELVPLPYRVLLLVNIGILFWYVIIVTCKRFQIDLLLVLKLKHHDVNIAKMAASTRSTLVKVTLTNLCNYCVYLFFLKNSLVMPILNWFPLFGLLFIGFILYNPRFFSNSQQPSIEGQRLSQTLRRIIRGGIDPTIRNNDIILTDTLTSYNKTIIDLLIYLSSLLLGLDVLPLNSKELKTDHIQVYNLDLLLANFPSALRFNQCLYEYRMSGYKNKTHLFNSIKYSTAFFPTICLILKRTGFLHSNGFWVFFSLINSSYSFFWDISNDWNFGFFYKYITGKHELPMLRNKMIYDTKFYLIAIASDFTLRFIWIFKIIYPSSVGTTSQFGMMMYFLFNTEIGSFISQLLELFRRWVWIFVKVETEFIKMKSVDDNDVELQSIK